MSTSVEAMAFLHAHGLEIEPKDLPALLRDAIRNLQNLYYPWSGQDGLTAAEIAIYRSGGLDPSPRRLGRKDPLLGGVMNHAGLVETGLTTIQAAKMLGVTDARIRQRLKERTLLAIKAGGAWRLPLFQFSEGRELPGWAEVALAIPRGVSPVTLASWLMLPNGELVPGEDGPPMSPRAWLLDGRPAEAVAQLAGALA
jgi:hypothetical protein